MGNGESSSSSTSSHGMLISTLLEAPRADALPLPLAPSESDRESDIPVPPAPCALGPASTGVMFSDLLNFAAPIPVGAGGLSAWAASESPGDV